MKRIKLLVLIVAIILLTGCTYSNDNKLTIVTTNFPSYDFVRSIVKDSDIELKMLLKPGTESHDYEPTPKDIIDIKNSNMFIYIGGESDSWIDTIIDTIDSDTKVIKLMDLVTAVNEEHIEGMEIEEETIEEELDEHVWTSPINAIKIVKELTNEIVDIDSSNKNLYEDNSNNYITELESIDKEIRETVKNSKRKELIFADRFPFRYFTDEYNLTYYAAFPGCSDKTEVSAKTIAFLIDKIKEDNIPVILKIEFSNGSIANAISEELDVKVLEFNSCHNVSQTDFNNSITYVDLMKNNIEVLKEALN